MQKIAFRMQIEAQKSFSTSFHARPTFDEDEGCTFAEPPRVVLRAECVNGAREESAGIVVGGKRVPIFRQFAAAERESTVGVVILSAVSRIFLLF